MTLIRPVLLLAGLLGSVSVFVGTAFETSDARLPETCCVHDAAAGSDGTVDNAQHVRQTSFCLDRNTGVESVLVITSCEAPRRQSRITIDVEPGRDHTFTPLSWQPSPLVPHNSSQPRSRMITADAPETAITALLPSKSEQWFLPNNPTARERTVVVQSIEVADTPRVRVVLDQLLSDDTQLRGRCRQLASRMSATFIPAIEAVFGPVADRCAERKLTIVVTPLVRQIASGNPPVDAFVLATDFREDLVRPFSNECDAIYVHPELSPEKSDAVLVHELTHVAQFCAFRRHHGASPWPLADWILEGTAHAAESLLTDNHHNVQDRLDAFAAAPELSPLRVVDAAREKLWRDSRCRGAACSFFTWLGQTYGMNAVGEICTKSPTSENAWHSVTGKENDELVRDWQTSLIATRSVHLHDISAGKPLTLTVLGGATAFIRLPGFAGANPITIRTTTPDSTEWTSWVHSRRCSTASEVTGADHCGAGVAFTSPVTIIR